MLYASSSYHLRCLLTFLSLPLQLGSVNEFTRLFFVCWGWMSWQIPRAGLQWYVAFWAEMLMLFVTVRCLNWDLPCEIGLNKQRAAIGHCCYCSVNYVVGLVVWREGILLQSVRPKLTSSTCTGPVAFGLQLLWFWISAIPAQSFALRMDYVHNTGWSVNWLLWKHRSKFFAVLCQIGRYNRNLRVALFTAMLIGGVHLHPAHRYLYWAD